jgi:mRNA interferase RelE/StbE
MIVDFKSSFLRDIKKIKDFDLLHLIELEIKIAEDADNINEINNIKKLSGYKNAYRIKINDYRLGLVIDNEMITFVRFLHRKDIYKFFP